MFASRPKPGSRRRASISARAVLLYLMITMMLVRTAAHGGAGFSYALDAPYLALTLAQHIAHGTYRINAGEVASPVSSIVWPLLLAPFSLSGVRCWVPFLLNVLPGVGVCLLSGCFMRRYFEREMRHLSEVGRWLLALLMVIAANLPALSLVGMEHSLQVLLASACALGCAEAYYGQKIPTWCLVCACIAPSIRYEGLAFTVALCSACWFQGRRLAATVTCLLSLFPLSLFGFFLWAHGLPFVPPSTLTEGRVVAATSAVPLLPHLAAILAANARAYVVEPQRWPITLLAVLLSLQCWMVRRSALRRQVLLGTLAGLVLFMALGPFGYFYQYDVACRFFAFLMVFAVAAEYKWFAIPQATGLAAVAAATYAMATVQTTSACWSTAHAQKQLYRFTHEFYAGNVATNDPGWVAFDAKDHFYTMDLHHHVPETEVLAIITSHHHVELAMLSSQWQGTPPPAWRRMGTLHRYGDGFNRVAFFATQPAGEDAIRRSLHAFAASLPQGCWLTYEDGSRSDTDR